PAVRSSRPDVATGGGADAPRPGFRRTALLRLDQTGLDAWANRPAGMVRVRIGSLSVVLPDDALEPGGIPHLALPRSEPWRCERHSGGLPSGFRHSNQPDPIALAVRKAFDPDCGRDDAHCICDRMGGRRATKA